MGRRKDFDFAKGVGIVLMVLGHCYSAGNGEGILCWLYSFHMPLFFIIPGIVYRVYPQKNEKVLDVIPRKMKKFLIPYFFFGTVAAIVLCVLGRKTLSEFGYDMWRIITLQGIKAMWFIPCFLIAELILIFVICAKHPQKRTVFLAVAGFAAVCFPVLSQLIPMMQRVVIGTTFLALGFLWSDIYTKPISTARWIATFIFHIAAALLNGRVDLAYGVYGNPVMYFLNGLLGTFLIIHAARFFLDNKFGKLLVWLGQNTIVVLCTSSLVIEILRLLDYKLFGSVLPDFGSAEGVILCTLTMMTEMILIRYCKKYLWFLTATAEKNGISNSIGSGESGNRRE